MAGVIESRTFMRQLEFDADRYERCIAGSQSFVSTSRKLRFLSNMESFASNFVFACFERGVVPDNLPRLKFALVHALDRQLVTKGDEARRQETRSWFKTHPTDAERDAMARLELQPGIYRVRHTAAWLLKDYKTLCKIGIRELYANFFLEHFSPHMLRPLGRFITNQTPPEPSLA